VNGVAALTARGRGRTAGQVRVARRIEIRGVRSLDDYAEYAYLAQSVEALRQEAEAVSKRLAGRTVWMVNSTARGGGVSELLPGMVAHLRELGVATEWVVIETEETEFFRFTKRIHNLIHGNDGNRLTREDRDLFEAVNRANADVLAGELKDGDVLVVHDPQPLPLAGMLRERLDLTALWRCHIGLDDDTPGTESVWSFLEPYADPYDHAIFSAPEYVPPYFEGRSSIIYPALDPLSPKNRPLPMRSLVTILRRAGLLDIAAPNAEQSYAHVAKRLQADGSFGPATQPDEPGLLVRPIVLQVSRWDRLKGFLPLMQGFERFRERVAEHRAADAIEERRLHLARLVLAGPDPEAIADDPEGQQVLDELRDEYTRCRPDVRDDIVLLALPMQDATENALIVNALQRVSTVIAQNSLREGFGLTITEAMWKGVPVLTNSQACGPRQQVRDNMDGRMIPDPADADCIAETLLSMLSRRERLESWGRSAQRRVHDHFLIHSQLQHWLRLLGRLAG
jgi:trehalose synthase